MKSVRTKSETPNPEATRIPALCTEEDERQFWSTYDSTALIDWKSAQCLRFPNLKPSSRRF